MNPTAITVATTFAPFLAFAVALLFFMKRPVLAKAIVLLGGLVSVVGSLMLLAGGPREPVRFLWFASGDVALRFGFLYDGLSLSFGAVVAVITFCIQVYSIGYMAHDPAKTRFFAMLGLFGWAMLGFVYSVDLLQAFIFWELVGLASFFLIGFWYEKPSAAAAAKKAFIMTRVGDVGLFIGILIILNSVGIFDIPALLDPETGLRAALSPGMLTIVMLLIFVGIMGKSAQFPLHTWLPDAMEGPTPVSALLHSATMVAAGVYLFARLNPLFMASETTLLTVLYISTFTAILSSTVAMVERDIKKVLAYSSISQLGFMLMALAAGGFFAGVFHLITHALFKALLFLCAGSYIHHLETNDMEEIGRRGGRKMRWTTVGLVIGGGALAGIPPLAGFFSKEEIFAALSHRGILIFQAGAFAAAFLTAYYTFRMIFLILLPARTEEPAHAHGHGNDSPLPMLAPIMLLTLAAAGVGFGGGWLARLLDVEREHHAITSMLPAIGIVLAGVALAWWDFGRRAATRTGFITAVKPLHTLFTNKWYVDAFYANVVARLTDMLAGLLQTVENKGFDDSFDGAARGVVETGSFTAKLQSGWVQSYAAVAIAMMSILGIYLGLR
ncbi:MAG: NADH-quinone oxidoreductase subunit [Candidatus Sumerlaeota bacterium]|nr:NADH-quinone oxidoreductase subunit [Candidatus Sumerlaeota bacterium]